MTDLRCSVCKFFLKSQQPFIVSNRNSIKKHGTQPVRLKVVGYPTVDRRARANQHRLT